MTNLNPTAVLAFYTARKRKGDTHTLWLRTKYSSSHISNVLAGRRTINDDFAKELMYLAKDRSKNKDVAIYL